MGPFHLGTGPIYPVSLPSRSGGRSGLSVPALAILAPYTNVMIYLLTYLLTYRYLYAMKSIKRWMAWNSST